MDKLIDYEGLGNFREILVNDSSIFEKSTWSSDKISTVFTGVENDIINISTALLSKANASELAQKQNLLTAGDNISMSGDTINADGYKYDASNYAFATKYTYGQRPHINTASGINSFAEGQGSTASGRGSHAEGEFTIAGGDGSHAEGYKTTTTNYFEHSEGMNNVSHTDGGNYHHSVPTNTIHSIGIGIDDGDPDTPTVRKNAVEVMYNGDYYLYGVGGYQGIDTHVQNASIMTVQSYLASLEARIYALEHPTT